MNVEKNLSRVEVGDGRVPHHQKEVYHHESTVTRVCNEKVTLEKEQVDQLVRSSPH